MPDEQERNRQTDGVAQDGSVTGIARDSGGIFGDIMGFMQQSANADYSGIYAKIGEKESDKSGSPASLPRTHKDSDTYFKFQAPFVFQGGAKCPPNPLVPTQASHGQCSKCGHKIPLGIHVYTWTQNSPRQNFCEQCGYLHRPESIGLQSMIGKTSALAEDGNRAKVPFEPEFSKGAPVQDTLGLQESEEGLDHLALANELQKEGFVEVSIEYYNKGLVMAQGDQLKSAFVFNRSVAYARLGSWVQVRTATSNFLSLAADAA